MARLVSDWLQLIVAFVNSLVVWWLTLTYRPSWSMPRTARTSADVTKVSDAFGPALRLVPMSSTTGVHALQEPVRYGFTAEIFLYRYIVVGAGIALPFIISWSVLEWEWSTERLIVGSLLLYTVPAYLTLFAVDWSLFYPQVLVVGFGLFGTAVAHTEPRRGGGFRLGNDWIQFLVAVGFGGVAYMIPVFLT